MKNKISVNILIPAYNAEKTIVNCLQSVFEQDYDNIQIIIINDGSTDSTDKLLKEISVEHKNIKVLKQTNHGLAYTRKALIDKASADYLVNLDADDTLTDKYSISNLINASHNGQDQMVCGKRNLVKDNKTRSLFIGSCFSKRANIKKYSFRTLGFCTGILISTKFIQKHFNFDIHYGCAEDRMLMFSISPYIERFSAINKYVYNYFVNSDSMTHSSKHYRICNEDWKNVNDFLKLSTSKSLKQDKFVEKLRRIFVFDCLANALNRIKYMTSKEKNDTILQIKEVLHSNNRKFTRPSGYWRVLAYYFYFKPKYILKFKL